VNFGPLTTECIYAANVCPAKINSARDLGHLDTSIANVFGTDQAIDERKTALSTTIPSTFDQERWSTNAPKMNTAHAACMRMQLHSQAAFLGAKFQPLNCLPSRNSLPGPPQVGLCPICLVSFFSISGPYLVIKCPSVYMSRD